MAASNQGEESVLDVEMPITDEIEQGLEDLYKERQGYLQGMKFCLENPDDPRAKSMYSSIMPHLRDYSEVELVTAGIDVKIFEQCHRNAFPGYWKGIPPTDDDILEASEMEAQSIPQSMVINPVDPLEGEKDTDEEETDEDNTGDQGEGNLHDQPGPSSNAKVNFSDDENQETKRPVPVDGRSSRSSSDGEYSSARSSGDNTSVPKKPEAEDGEGEEEKEDGFYYDEGEEKYENPLTNPSPAESMSQPTGKNANTGAIRKTSKKQTSGDKSGPSHPNIIDRSHNIYQRRESRDPRHQPGRYQSSFKHRDHQYARKHDKPHHQSEQPQQRKKVHYEEDIQMVERDSQTVYMLDDEGKPVAVTQTLDAVKYVTNQLTEFKTSYVEHTLTQTNHMAGWATACQDMRQELDETKLSVKQLQEAIETLVLMVGDQNNHIGVLSNKIKELAEENKKLNIQLMTKKEPKPERDTAPKKSGSSEDTFREARKSILKKPKETPNLTMPKFEMPKIDQKKSTKESKEILADKIFSGKAKKQPSQSEIDPLKKLMNIPINSPAPPPPKVKSSNKTRPASQKPSIPKREDSESEDEVPKKSQFNKRDSGSKKTLRIDLNELLDIEPEVNLNNCKNGKLVGRRLKEMYRKCKLPEFICDIADQMMKGGLVKEDYAELLETVESVLEEAAVVEEEDY